MNKETFLATFFTAALFLGFGPAFGQSLSWDLGPGDGGTITGGSGTWNTTSSNWNNGSGNVIWNNASTAVFGGTAGTVTLGENITAAGLTLNSGYTIGTVGGTSTLTLVSATTAPTISKNAGSTINANLIASGPIRIVGNSDLTLNGNNSGLTGGVTIQGANTVFLANANSLGTGTVTIGGGTQPALGFNSAFTLANAIDLQGVIWSAGSQTNSYSGNLTVTGSGRGFTLWQRSVQHSGSISLGSNNLTIDQAGSGLQMTVSGVVSGTGRMIKNGAGTTLVLTGANTTFGGVTLNGGTLRVGNNDTALGAGALLVATTTANASETKTLATASGGGDRTLNNSVIITNNGTGTTTLALDGGFATLNLTSVISGSGGVQTVSSGIVRLTGANTYTGSTVLTGTNTLVLSGGTNTSGIVIGATNTLALRSITVNAPISGAGAVTKDITFFGASTVNGNNTYTGATTVNIDRFTVGSTGIINGTSGISVLSQWGANFNNLGSVTTPGNITVAGSGNTTSGGVTADSSFFRNAGTVNAANIVLNSSSAANTSANRGGTYSQSAGSTVLSGALILAANGGTGAAGTAGNDAAFNLSGGTFNTPVVNLNAGTVNLTGGTLNVGSGGIVGTNTNTAFNLGNATLASTAAFSSSINVNLNGTGGSAIDSSGGNIALGGVLSGTGGFTKNGSGSLILTGNNTYAGSTAVAAGVLLVNGTNSGLGSVLVGGSGTLGGTGSLAGAVTVNGTLSPGASIESLNTGAVTFNGGSTFAYELNSSALTGDLLNVAGNLTLNAAPNLLLTDLGSGSFSFGSKLTLISYSGSWNGGVFGGFADGAEFMFGSNLWRIDYNDLTAGGNGGLYGNFVTITAIPEPTSILLVGTAMLLVRRRRR